MAQRLPRNIRRLGRKFWVEKMIDGHRHRKGFLQLDDAIGYLRELEIRAVRGASIPRPTRVKLADWFAEFLGWVKNERASSTYDNYAYALSKLQPFLEAQGVEHLDEVTAALLERFKHSRVDARSQRGGTIKPGTVNQELKLCSACFERAVKLGFIEENPFKKVERLRARKRPPKYLSTSEVRILLDGARSHDRPLYALLYYTGLRIGEALHLQWSDILWDYSTIVVRGKEDWEPKTGQSRAVPLHPDLVAYLEELPTHSEWVFAFPDGRRRKYSGVKANFSRLCDRVGLEDVTLHTLRHNAESRIMPSSVVPVLCPAAVEPFRVCSGRLSSA